MERGVWSSGTAATEPQRRLSGMNVVFGLAAALYVLFAVVAYRHAVNVDGETAGKAVGQAIAPLLVAAVLRAVYVAARWRWSRVPFMSGWLLVLAALFAFMLTRSPSS